MAEPGHIPQCQPPWKWRAQMKVILRQVKPRPLAGPTLTQADLQVLNVTLGQPKSFASADIEFFTEVIDNTKTGKGLLERLNYSKAIGLDYREKEVDTVVCGCLKLLAERISGHTGKALSKSSPNNRQVQDRPLRLRLLQQRVCIGRQAKNRVYKYLTPRCMGYRHRRSETFGVLSLTLPSHPGENRVSAPELFCLAVAASEQLYSAYSARNVPSFFTVRVLSTSKSNYNLYRIVKARIPLSYLYSLLDMNPSPPSKRLVGTVIMEQSRYFDMFVPGDLQKLMGAVFTRSEW